MSIKEILASLEASSTIYSRLKSPVLARSCFLLFLLDKPWIILSVINKHKDGYIGNTKMIQTILT